MEMKPEDKENLFLQMDILDRDFGDLCKLFRSGEAYRIQQDTWNLLADHLEGKIKKRQGRRKDVLTHLFVNEPLYREFGALCREGNTQEGARAIMARRLVAKKEFFELLKQRSEEEPNRYYKRKEAREIMAKRAKAGLVGESADYEEKIRGRIDAYIKQEKEFKNKAGENFPEE